MKYGQLIECNMRNIFFFEKSYTKCGVETSPRPFSEKLKIIVSLDQQSQVLCSLFYCISSSGLSKCIETKLQTTCFYLILSYLKKQREVWNYFPCFIFRIIFLQYFPCYILLIDQVSLSGCLYFERYWTLCVLRLFINQVVTS